MYEKRKKSWRKGKKKTYLQILNMQLALEATNSLYGLHLHYTAAAGLINNSKVFLLLRNSLLSCSNCVYIYTNKQLYTSKHIYCKHTFFLLDFLYICQTVFNFSFVPVNRITFLPENREKTHFT